MSETQNNTNPSPKSPAPRPAGSAPRPAGSRPPMTGNRPPMGNRPAGSRPFTSSRPAGGAPRPGMPARRRIVRGEKPGEGTTGSRPQREGADRRAERPRSEYEQKMIDIRRVTRVVAGGRRMSFAVVLAIGDKKGLVGLGTGKGADTAIAMAKALKQAKKNLIKLNLTDKMSLPHEVSAKFNASQIVIRPNKAKGMVAGSALREILTLAGVHNVTGKINTGSKNKLSNARAAIKALSMVGKPAPVYTAAQSDAFTSK